MEKHSKDFIISGMLKIKRVKSINERERPKAVGNVNKDRQTEVNKKMGALTEKRRHKSVTK